MNLSNIKVNNSNVIGVDDEPISRSDNLVKSGGIFSFARNYKKTLTAEDNIDTLKVEGSYLVNTTLSSGTFPTGLGTYSVLSIFGVGDLVYQLIASTRNPGTDNRKIWFRSVISSASASFEPWVEMSWNNIDNGLLTAESNIDSLTKSGGYIIPTNTTPQGTLPSGFVANATIANLIVFANSNNLYFQILYKEGNYWARNYNTSWVKLNAPDLSEYFRFEAILYNNENIDTLTGQRSWLLNTTLVSGTLPTGVPTYAMLMQFGTGGWLVQILSQTTAHTNPKTWIRTKANNGAYTDWVEITNKDVPEPVDPSQPLYGKKIVFFGDSVTEGSAAGAQGQINNYPQFVATRTGATITNVGIGGTQMANHVAAPDYNPFSFCNLITAITTNVWTTQDEKASVIGKTTQLAALKALDLSTYDYCVIAYGQNDRSNGVVVGNSDSVDNDEFYGALNNSINALLTAYPNLHLIYIAPYNRVSAPASNPMLPFVNAILDVADKWAMPSINLYKISGINVKTVSTYLEDGLHPKLDSKYGYEFLGNVIGAQMLSFI